jgi:serine/threonine-protein kinase
VFLAEDLKHHRPVALKVLDPEVASAIGPERFLREIETVARLNHPHILPLFDSGEAGGLLYYVMPFVEGESLRDRLEREKQLPLEEALRITREVADALGYAHGRGVVHRDIKPENILLEGPHALVADFGIARAVAAVGGAKLTATGVAVGTPAYLSPEQAAGGAVDSRSDLYGLGCVLYEMLAGVPPFTAPTAENLIYQHLNVAPRPVTELRPAVPAGVAGAITKALAKTPADRFASTGEFAAALAPSGSPGRDGDASPSPAAPAPPRTRRAGLVAGVAAAVAVIAVIAVAAWQDWWPFGARSSAPRASKDWILVAEFEGPPGDSTLAPAARSLLSAALDQSRIVATVSQDQIRQALRAAGKPANARVDAELARELAYRSAVRAVLEGTIGRLGKGYSIVLKVVDADTPRVVLTRSGTPREDDDLIPALAEMAKQLRRGLGENRDALRATRPMTQAATPSFEAYRLFVQGVDGYSMQTSNRSALRFYRAAVALDPDFASAWFAMARLYINLNHPDSARMCLDEASRLPERLPSVELQRLEILRSSIDGDSRRAAAAIDRILADDPGNAYALAWGNDALCRVGRIEEALERTREAMRLSPFGPTDGMRINEVADLLRLGRYDEAREANRHQSGIWKTVMRSWIELAAGRFAVAESIATASPDDPRLREDLPEGLKGALASARFGRGAAGDAAANLKDIVEIYRVSGHRLLEDETRRFWIEYSVVSAGAVPLPPGPAIRDTSASALLTGGLQAAVTRDRALALRCLEAARSRPRRELAPLSVPLALLDARIHAIADRPEEAVRLLRPFAAGFMEQGASLTWAHWWLADASEQMGRPDSAAFYLERSRSVAFMPDDGAERPYVHRRLALLYARLGKLPDAERHLAAAERAWDRPDAAVRRMLEEARAAVRAARGLAQPERGRSQTGKVRPRALRLTPPVS